MDTNTIIITIGLSAFVLLLLVYSLKLAGKNKEYVKRFSKIIDVEDEFNKINTEKQEVEHSIETLRESYADKKAVFDKLVETAAIYDEEIELTELGFYKPHYDFDTSEKYKEARARIRSRQKDMISAKTAIVCKKEWAVDGSKAKGRTMTNRQIRLTARAFNNECDAAMGSVSWNNATRMVERIKRAFTAINKMNASNEVYISNEYLDLKLDDLRLVHEYKEKRQQEKEEQAEIRRQMREEAKLEKEMQKAIKDEEKYQKLILKAKREAEKASGAKLDALQAKMESLTKELEEAHSKSERAKSMAQQTKAGHVYVLSNVGSFGKHIYKIGMTRRLVPEDRVKELGDASVPFVFDVHAMVFTQNAPGMEKALHNKFDRNRVNLVNLRKEFFRVGLKDIETEVKKIAPESEFILTVKARDFRESHAIRAQRARVQTKEDIRAVLPQTI